LPATENTHACPKENELIGGGGGIGGGPSIGGGSVVCHHSLRSPPSHLLHPDFLT